MTAAALVRRLDDLCNPIVVKELRQATKSWVVTIALLLFLLLQLGVLLFILLLDAPRHGNPVNLHAGRQIFEVLQGILLGTCMLLIPTYAGVRLAAEHSDTNVDLLFISTLRPRAIIAGKFQASVALILLIFSASAPFMTFTYLLRGIDIPTILFVLGVDFLAVLLATQVAIFLGAAPTNWGLKVLLGIVGLGVQGGLFGIAMAYSMTLLELGLGGRMDTADFWLITGAVVTAVAALLGLLFCWSVAVVSPTSANRALLVRLYLLGAWLVTAGVAAFLAWRFQSSIPLQIWMLPTALLLCVQILTSINEREQCGPRLARTIPRPWWLRGPAFLVYSGAAGGLIFSAVLLAVTIAVPGFILWHESDPYGPIARFEIDIGRRNVVVMALIALYTFDYSMTAVFLRSVFLPRLVKPLYTWVIAVLLFGLGFALPYPLLFLFQNEELRMGQVNPWCQISNPLATIFEYADRRTRRWEDFHTGGLVFLSIWAALALLLCLPWIVRQARRFRPPERVTVAE
jgi:hypothetical protein